MTVPPEAQQQPTPRNPVAVGEADVAAGGEGGVAVGEKREEGDGAESEGATGGAVFEASSPDSESKSVLEGWCLLASFQSRFEALRINSICACWKYLGCWHEQLGCRA